MHLIALQIYDVFFQSASNVNDVFYDEYLIACVFFFSNIGHYKKEKSMMMLSPRSEKTSIDE
jgi:hypothetical protein